MSAEDAGQHRLGRDDGARQVGAVGRSQPRLRDLAKAERLLGQPLEKARQRGFARARQLRGQQRRRRQQQHPVWRLGREPQQQMTDDAPPENEPGRVQSRRRQARRMARERGGRRHDASGEDLGRTGIRRKRAGRRIGQRAYELDEVGQAQEKSLLDGERRRRAVPALGKVPPARERWQPQARCDRLVERCRKLGRRARREQAQERFEPRGTRCEIGSGRADRDDPGAAAAGAKEGIDRPRQSGTDRLADRSRGDREAERRVGPHREPAGPAPLATGNAEVARPALSNDLGRERGRRIGVQERRQIVQGHRPRRQLDAPLGAVDDDREALRLGPEGERIGQGRSGYGGNAIKPRGRRAERREIIGRLHDDRAARLEPAHQTREQRDVHARRIDRPRGLDHLEAQAADRVHRQGSRRPALRSRPARSASPRRRRPAPPSRRRCRPWPRAWGPCTSSEKR